MAAAAAAAAARWFCSPAAAAICHWLSSPGGRDIPGGRDNACVVVGGTVELEVVNEGDVETGGGGGGPCVRGGGGGCPPPAAAAAAAAMAAPGNMGKGGGPVGCPSGGLPMPNIMALAFSAAAAAAMMLLFSASERRGERKRSEGSIPGGSGYPIGSLWKKRAYSQ